MQIGRYLDWPILMNEYNNTHNKCEYNNTHNKWEYNTSGVELPQYSSYVMEGYVTI